MKGDSSWIVKPNFYELRLAIIFLFNEGKAKNVEAPNFEGMKFFFFLKSNKKRKKRDILTQSF